MEYDFAPRMDSLKPSVIREILKYSSDPEVIPFSAGNPAAEAFPVEVVRETLEEIMQNDPIGALQYSVTEGLPALRNRVRADLKQRLQIGSDDDDVLIMTGAQQVIDLTAKAFCRPGDVVICESPSFLGALNAFKANDARLVGVEMEDDGVNLEQLEQAMKQNPTARLFYTIPNFQNPMGVTMSLAKRKAVLALAKKYGVVVLEDNPYGELRFEGEDIPAIKTMDTDGAVVYSGSFSKVLAPGLRAAFVCAPKEVIQKITVLKQTNDVHTNVLAQKITLGFLEKVNFGEHIRRLREIYRRKAGLMLDEMRRQFATDVTWTHPQGGMFLWCTLPEGADMQAFCTAAVKEHKVAVVPGNAFLMDDRLPCRSFRMNYSTPSDEQIVRGIKILGELTKQL